MKIFSTKTTKFILYNIIIIMGYTIIIVALYTLFAESIYIETHMNEKVVYLSGGILCFSIIIASLALSKILGEKVYESAMRFTMLILMSSLSMNVVSLFKMSIKILGFNDIIFRSKFFTIHYKYSKKELLMYISKYYEEISGGEKTLPMKEKIKILGDAKTITEVQERVEKYYQIEVNSWSTKIYNFLESGISWCADHPAFAASALVGIGGLILMPTIRSLYNSYNIYKLSSGVSDMNQSVSLLNNENQNIISLFRRLESAVTQLNEADMNIMKLLSDYFHFNARAIVCYSLTEQQQANYVQHMESFQRRLTTVEIPASISEIKQEPIDDRITFNQGHILGGTVSRENSRLLNTGNNEN